MVAGDSCFGLMPWASCVNWKSLLALFAGLVDLLKLFNAAGMLPRRLRLFLSIFNFSFAIMIKSRKKGRFGVKFGSLGLQICEHTSQTNDLV